MDDIEDADVEKLEREIEEVLRNRGDNNNGIVNINKSQQREERKSSAYSYGGNIGKVNRNMMGSAYRQSNDGRINDGGDIIGDDIYEDEESSGNER